MRPKTKKGNRSHPGVSVMRIKRSGRWIARWSDPIDGAVKEADLAKNGASNETTRKEWAKRKSQEIAKLRGAVATGAVTPTHTEVAQCVADYLETVTTGSTRINKTPPLEAFAAWCKTKGVKAMTSLSGVRLMGWRDHVLGNGRDHEPSTRNRWLITTGIMLRWAMHRGLAPLLTSDSIKQACIRAPEPAKAIEFLRPPELRQLLAAAIKFDGERRREWRIAPVILALLTSGCRFDELAKLEWSEVAFDAGEIRLDAHRTKTRAARVITMRETPTLLALLRVLHDRRGEAERVFPDLRHPLWEAAHLVLIEEFKAPEFSAHTLRRSCGTLLTNASGIYGGASAWHSAKRLGHSVQQAEAHYAGQLRDLPATATTLEQAAGITDLANAIVEAQRT